MSSKLLAVDLFSGAGGLSLGFVQTGQVRIAAAVENNRSAQQTYLENHPGVSIYGDIRNVDYNQILNECRKMGADKIDIVFGGPPCQGFSNANRQKASLISANNQLVKEFVKAIELLNPDGFVMENVKELKSNKHKFFLSLHDVEEVAELGLVPSEEKVSLGEVNTLKPELLVFLNETLRVSITSYVIGNKVLFSKLNHLYRKKNNAEVYLKKIRIAIKSFYDNWENIHEYYWSPKYKEKWM
jgi:DNA (cytosine-5)-methyltransferase 1